MIAQVVFDLPLEGPFDYSVPEHLASCVAVGMQVKVSFGPKIKTGFIVGLTEKSAFAKLKPLQSLPEACAVFSSQDLAFAREFSAYYGCSLGEALGTILRNQKGPSIRREHNPLLSLHRCRPDEYALKIQEIIEEYPSHSRFLILVPDSFKAVMISKQLNSLPLVGRAREGESTIAIGTRSSVFASDGRHACVIMTDDEDPSYREEQTPMYETRQVLLMRCSIYGFDVAFAGISPSVELMALAREGKVRLAEGPTANVLKARLVDLSNYKSVPGLLSPPVRHALDVALKAAKKSLLVLNRKGSYRVTRCTGCDEILKCVRCEVPLVYSRSQGQYSCRHCTFSLPGDTVCPKCEVPSWRSYGIGVEQLQTELRKHFPQAKIAAFERAARFSSAVIARSEATKQSLPEFDILIATQAVLRFQGTLKVSLAAFIDFDAELNRLAMRSAFNAFRLAVHVGCMAGEEMFIQTRNNTHYVLQSLASGRPQDFYEEELKLRKELGFSPFKHWIKITCRSKSDKSAQVQAQQLYDALAGSSSRDDHTVTPPLAEGAGRKRGQSRFYVMLQADDVPKAVAFIKSTLAQIPRRSQVIRTFEVDP